MLAVAGEGEAREPLPQLAESLGIRIGDLLGYRSDVGEFLIAADVFVIASYSEGLPIALIEAMALARRVVATRVGEIANALEGTVGPTTRIRATSTPGAAMDACERPDEAQRRVTAALQRYRARYSRAAMVQQYASCTRRCFDGSARASGFNRPIRDRM